MEVITYQLLAQLGAAFAVVASLGLVAYELKQGRDVAIAELTLSVYQAETQQFLSVLDAEAYRSGAYKIEVSGEELSWDEKKNIDRVFMGYNGITVSKYQLWKLGLLSDGEWEWEIEKLKEYWTESDLWLETLYKGAQRNPHFLKMLDSVVAEWEAEKSQE